MNPSENTLSMQSARTLSYSLCETSDKILKETKSILVNIKEIDQKDIKPKIDQIKVDTEYVKEMCDCIDMQSTAYLSTDNKLHVIRRHILSNLIRCSTNINQICTLIDALEQSNEN